MAEKSHQRMLEVAVIALKPTLWEWRVYEGDTPLMAGFASSRKTAQIWQTAMLRPGQFSSAPIAITFYDAKKQNLELIEIFLGSFVHGAHEVEGATHEQAFHRR